MAEAQLVGWFLLSDLRMPALHGIHPATLHPIGMRQSRVVNLLASGSPSNISRLVIAVVVDAVKSQMRCWFPPNVCKEGFEAVAPFIADRNSTAAVVHVGVTPLIVTTLKDRPPQPMLRAAAHAVRGVPSDISATTRSGCSYPQATYEDLAFSPAYASAQQVTQSISSRGLHDDGPIVNGGP